MARKKTNQRGKRLSPEQREAITNAPDEISNVELADTYGTTAQTVARYRKPRRGIKREAAKGSKSERIVASALSRVTEKGVTVEFDKRFVTIRAPRGNAIVKGLVNQLLA